jgi:hypothetical protein
MLSGLSSLNLFLMSSNTKNGRIILLLMLCLDDIILCFLNFIVTSLDLKLLKNNMLLMLILRMCCCIVERERHGINFCSMTGSCLELTAYTFQLDLFIFCCYRRRMEVVRWVTLVQRRRRTLWPHTSFGQR